MIAQGFALLGTLLGIFTIAIGIGPRSVLDIVCHVAIVAVLAWVWSWHGREWRHNEGLRR